MEIKRIVYAEPGRKSKHNGPLSFHALVLAHTLGVEGQVIAYDAPNADELLADGDFLIVAVEDERGVSFVERNYKFHPVVALMRQSLVSMARRFPPRLSWALRSVDHEEVPNLKQLLQAAVESAA